MYIPGVVVDYRLIVVHDKKGMIFTNTFGSDSKELDCLLADMKKEFVAK